MGEIQQSLHVVKGPPATPLKEVKPLADNPFLAVVQGIENTAKSLRESHPADAQLLDAASVRIKQQLAGWITKGQDIIQSEERATQAIPNEELAQRITGYPSDRMAVTVFRWNEDESRYGHGVPNQMLPYYVQETLLAGLSPTVPRRRLPVASYDLLDEKNWSEEAFNHSPGRLEHVALNTKKYTLRTSIPGVKYEVYEVTIPSGGIKSLDHNIVFDPGVAIDTIRSMRSDQLAQLRAPQST